MKKYYLILLGELFLNLGSVLAECTKEQDENTRNTIQWFIRESLTTYIFLKIRMFYHFLQLLKNR